MSEIKGLISYALLTLDENISIQDAINLCMPCYANSINRQDSHVLVSMDNTIRDKALYGILPQLELSRWFKNKVTFKQCVLCGKFVSKTTFFLISEYCESCYKDLTREENK